MFGPGSSKYKSFDDAALLHQFRKTGNLEVLGALYHRYMHLVYGVGLKYYKNTEESKDAVMQIFEKLIESVPKQEIQNFKSWLFVVTKNHCLMTLRKNKIEEDRQPLFMESDLVQHLNGEENEGYQASLNNALLNLPEHQRRCVQLFYYQSMSYQEISEATGYELKKVKSYIQNGKRKLKLYLAK